MFPGPFHFLGEVQPGMPFPSSLLFSIANLHSHVFQLSLIFMFHVSKPFYLHMDPIIHCTSSPKWYSPVSIYQACTILSFSIPSQIFIGTSSKHSLQHVLLPAAQAYPWAQVPTFVRSLVGIWKRCELWRFLEKVCPLEDFLSTASSLFIEDPNLFLMLLCCRDKPCLGHDVLLNFQLYVSVAGPAVSAPMEMAVPLVHITPMLQPHNCEPLSLVGPSEPITQPCKPGITFTLTSSAPHSSEALPFRAA